MSKDKDLEILEPTRAEEWKNPAKAALGSIPGIGSALVALFDHIYLEPLAKGRSEFIKQMCIDLQNLIEKVNDLTPERLAKDPVFTTAMANAVFVATRNHEKEKLDALRNAVLNTALPTKPIDDLVTVFLSFIDTFTPWHLRVLKYFENPRRALIEGEVEMERVREDSPVWGYIIVLYPDLKEREDFLKLVLRDLTDRQLITDVYERSKFIPKGMSTEVLKPMGREFLRFIESPLSENEETNRI